MSVTPLFGRLWGKSAQSVDFSSIRDAFNGDKETVGLGQDSTDKNMLSQANLRDEANRLIRQGANFYNISHYQRAISAFEDALKLYQQTTDLHERSLAISGIERVRQPL
jgi:hypothetical protein